MSPSVMFLIGVLLFGVGIAASIALHEIGHLLPAKRFGVKVTQYMVGFGPTVWSRRIGETEYGVKVVPLGGYIRMIGMFPPKPGQAPTADSTGRFGMLIEQARQDAERQVSPEDHGRLFYQRSVPKRLVIMLGGPMMNLLLGTVLLTVAMCAVGVSQLTPRVSVVSQCVLPAGSPVNATCDDDDPAAPAAVAGIRPGDVIVSVAGVPSQEWDDVTGAIRPNGGRTIPVVIERDGEQLTLTVTPIAAERQVYQDGEKVLDENGEPVTETVGFLGVSPTSALVRQPVSAVPVVLGDTLLRVAQAIPRLPEKMVGVAQAAFGGQERDLEGPVSVVGAGRIAGEITAYDGTAITPFGLQEKLAFLLSLLASLNLMLFAFNLLPLLPLDGGHVAAALWEGARRRVARLRRRPDPGPVDTLRLLPVTYGFAAVLLTMSVLLIYADLVNPIRLTG